MWIGPPCSHFCRYPTPWQLCQSNMPQDITLADLYARVEKCVHCGPADVLYDRHPTFENLCKYATTHSGRGQSLLAARLPNLNGAQVFICMRYMYECRRIYLYTHQSIIDSIWTRYNAIVYVLALGKYKRTCIPYDVWKIIARFM